MSERKSPTGEQPELPTKEAQARRAFVLGALAAVPALAACADLEEPALESNTEALRGPEREPRCQIDAALERLHRYWRKLVDLHMGTENAHDLEGVMATFSPEAEMIFNGMPFRTPQEIAAGHVLFGMSSQPGGLVDTQVAPECTYYLEDGVLIMGRVIATHVGDVLGLPGSGKRVSLPYGAIYQFDRAGTLVSERIVMNWVDLAVPPG